MAKLNAKKVGHAFAVGVGVLVATPILGGFVSGLAAPLAGDMFGLGLMSYGTFISGGVSAFLIMLGLEKLGWF